MSRDAMSARERWLAVLGRKAPDRVPMDYWATPEATEKLLRHCGCADTEALFRKLRIDKPVEAQPRYVGPAIPELADEFGCRYREVRYGTGSYRECIHHPLAEFGTLEDLRRGYRWPSPDWWDYSHLPALGAANADRPIRGGGSEPFLTYKYLRGDEQAFVDLVENPEIVHWCLDRLFDLAYEGSRRIYEALPGQVTLSYVAEDMGSQDDLLYSPGQIRTFFIPRMKRMIDLAHQAGASVFHHSDGGVRRIIPDMIQAGIDVLNPIQWRCGGMEREGLKRDFGASIIFHGGVDNQRTLPFGTPADVRAEVEDNLRILGAGGGYILAPCHNIQAVSPAENVVALYEAGFRAGGGGS
jgi:uroporphyrinogen decarboxylase